MMIPTAFLAPFGTLNERQLGRPILRWSWCEGALNLWEHTGLCGWLF